MKTEEQEFLSTEGISMRLIKDWPQSVNYEFLTEFLARHKAWLMEQENVNKLTLQDITEKDNYKQLKEVLIFQRERIKELEKEVQNYRDNSVNEWMPCKFADTIPRGYYIVIVERNDLLEYQYMVIDYLNPTVWYYYATAYFEINLPATNKKS